MAAARRSRVFRHRSPPHLEETPRRRERGLHDACGSRDSDKDRPGTGGPMPQVGRCRKGNHPRIGSCGVSSRLNRTVRGQTSARPRPHCYCCLWPCPSRGMQCSGFATVSHPAAKAPGIATYHHWLPDTMKPTTPTAAPSTRQMTNKATRRKARPIFGFGDARPQDARCHVCSCPSAAPSVAAHLRFQPQVPRPRSLGHLALEVW